MLFVFVGPPGAGKGTQSKRLVDYLDAVHLSTGEILRAAIQDQSELGKEAQKFIDQGQLVPDQVMIDLIGEQLREVGERNCLLDGFPRTIQQAEALDELLQRMGLQIQRVLALNVEADVYQVAHRRKLPKKIYFSVLNPSRPLSIIEDVGVVVPDLLGDRLVRYDPLGGQDGHITVHDSPLDLPTDVVVTDQQLIILDSARERVVVSSQEGQLLRQFRLSPELKRQLVGLTGTNEAAYLVLSDGVWRCDRLLDDRV